MTDAIAPGATPNDAGSTPRAETSAPDAAPAAPATPDAAAATPGTEVTAAETGTQEVANDVGGLPAVVLRRTVRTPASESWDLLAEDGGRLGTVALHFADARVEAVLAVVAGFPDEARRNLLGYTTELLALDEAAGPGGVIHWTTVSGEATEYWRRSPGRRKSGAEHDLDAVKARVRAVLASGGTEVIEVPEGDVAVDIGSVRVFAAVRLADTVPAVRVFAITNLEADATGDLPAFLLSVNFSLALGRFSLDPSRGAVWCDHVVIGDVDEDTLARVVGAVASAADRYDDEIKQRYGGRTFREDGSPVEQAAMVAPPLAPNGAVGMAGGYL